MVRPPYQAALRLQAIAAERWAEIDGSCAARGTDPFLLRPDRFCNLIYWWAVNGMDEDKRREWDQLLLDPMPEQKRSAKRAPMEAAEFEAFMGQMMSV